MGSTWVEQSLKRRYPSNQKIVNQSFIKTRFMRKVPRTITAGGDSWNSFLMISGGVGWSGSRLGAQAIADQGGGRGNGAFQQVRNSYGKIAGEVTINDFDIDQGDNESASAFRAMFTQTDGHLAMLGQQSEWMVLGDPGMWVCKGTIASDGTVTITSNAEHITRIRKDMLLVASATDGTGGSLLGGGSIGYVQKVARSGSITTFVVSTTSGGSGGVPAGWTGTMYFFIYEMWKGSNGGAGVDAGVNQGFVIDTISSWVPAAAPSATPFKNMVRTDDELLGGVRATATEVATLNSAQRIEYICIQGRSRFGWDNESDMEAMVHTSRFNEINQLLQRTDMRQMGFAGTMSKTSYGYNVITMTSIGCNVTIVDNPMQDPDFAWVISAKNWELASSAGWPNVVNKDGLRFIRKYNVDGLSLQYTGYGSLRTTDPSKTARVPFT
jgi:hypothetical protein